jgi:DNA-binding beta-propeller fold protein YncE
MLRRRRSAVILALLFTAACGDETGQPITSSSTHSGTGGGTTTSTGTGGGPDVDDVMSSIGSSCAFSCGGCAEPETPYACPTVAAWETLPHADACGGWDGKYPAVTPGQCTATLPSGEAARPAGPLAGGGLVLPDGHRIQPAGRDFLLDGDGLVGGFPMSITPLAGTKWALVSDGGIIDNALRLVDTDALASGGAPIADTIPFHQPDSLFYGITFLAPDVILASGGGDAMVYGFKVDAALGKITRDATLDVSVGMGTSTAYYVGPVAATADGARLVVAPSTNADDLRIFSLAAADHGAQLASIPIGSKAVFDLRRDPFDPAGKIFYATDIEKARLLEIDGAAGTVTRTVALTKNPAQLVFLDGTYVAVASSDGDEIAVVDRAAMNVVSRVPVFEKDGAPGFSPTALAYDAAAKRIYATLAGVNAVEVYDVSGTPPTLTPTGRVPTAWWPTGVMTRADGSLVVINGKGHGTGTDGLPYTFAQGSITQHMNGSLQHVPSSALADLAAQSAVVDQGHKLGELAGHSTISCPSGVADFPIPATNTEGPSAQIKHVILVVRENKTYDAVFGDRKDLGDGDPALIMAGDVDLQGKVWQNARRIAEQFTNFDNFYTDAEQSIQGHTWTVFGRTTDFMERTWLSTWGRATRNVGITATAVDAPAEGGVFQWLDGAHVAVENMGELIGNFKADIHYPGVFYAQGKPDVEKSCYIAGRARLRCDLASFTYVVQSNDHTYGGQAGSAAPEVMIAVNDEASGLLLDALSHSPYWKDTLLVITEDDPQDGGDHIDMHRTPLLMASPWIKRGYVSKTHLDMAGVYKLVAHVFGIPYHNDMIKNAALPLDAFSSTPDYTPFTYLPRKVTAPCNAAGSSHAVTASQWDFDDIDEQPGLSRQIMEMMREPRDKRGVRVIP